MKIIIKKLYFDLETLEGQTAFFDSIVKPSFALSPDHAASYLNKYDHLQFWFLDLQKGISNQVLTEDQKKFLLEIFYCRLRQIETRLQKLAEEDKSIQKIENKAIQNFFKNNVSEETIVEIYGSYIQGLHVITSVFGPILVKLEK